MVFILYEVVVLSQEFLLLKVGKPVPLPSVFTSPGNYAILFLMKNLPIGIQTFSEIILNNYLYIDKTKEIASLITTGKYFFLSRPRRFGKSLLVSTLKEIFSGNKELFKGLYIYDKIEWKKHPVIHIDFSIMIHDKPEHLLESINYFIKNRAEQAGITLKATLPEDRFMELIEKLSGNKKTVVLIDEYDKPIIGVISHPEKAGANREILRNFYTVLKGADPYLRFVFLTGVSKFSKVSIFSGLNNLKDITLSNLFSTIVGLTETEIINYFDDRLEELSRIEKSNKATVFEQIRHWYNGYSWDAINRVYNPTSILNLFFDKRFSNYWFSTGTPTFLINLLKEKKIDITDINNKQVSEYIFESYDIENLNVYSLLFQTGYLTISRIYKKRGNLQYQLVFPNYEVKESLLNHLLASFSGKEVADIQPFYLELLDCLDLKNIDQFQILLASLFAGIPYNLHIKEERYYHSLFYMILSLMGARIDLEVLSDKGRMDAVLELDELIYVIEFKMGTPKQAIEQIKQKWYYEAYLKKEKEVHLLGVGGFTEKKIGCLIEKVSTC